MKRILFILFIIIAIAGGIIAWIFFGPGTAFSDKKLYLYIPSKSPTKESVLDSLQKKAVLSNESAFNFLADQMKYWDNIKPGRYEISKGASLVSIVRMLRNGNQSPVNLVITKLRTKEDFARVTGNKFEFDSLEIIQLLNNSDSLIQYEVNPETVFFNVIPNTYTYLWTSSPRSVYRKLYEERKKFWTDERLQKAEKLGITPLQAYIVASITEEETNYHKEKDTIASVYFNRVKRGMPLGADPTIKFALKDFSIKWIRGEMLNVESPYNTYRNKGLPPGPISTPSAKTIDAVLNAPQTEYLFFVANSNFSGSHLFSRTFAEHLQKAKAFQQEDKRRREAKEKK